jgi:hypothetical protein
VKLTYIPDISIKGKFSFVYLLNVALQQLLGNWRHESAVSKNVIYRNAGSVIISFYTVVDHTRREMRESFHVSPTDIFYFTFYSINPLEPSGYNMYHQP